MNPAAMIWVNGERQATDMAHVSAADRGLTLADGLFETMRAPGGRVFRLDRHLERLERSLAQLAIPSPPELRDWLQAAFDAWGTADASVRLTVTRGSGPGGVAPPLDVHPTVIIALNPMPMFRPETYARGLTAHLAAGTRNPRAMTAGLKTLAYTDAIAAFIHAQRAGADDALFLDTEGHCSEATSSNLFLWTGSVLRTPPTSCAALPGITRATVLELARALGLDTSDTPIELQDLRAAREAFLTSSLRGLAPLVAVDEVGGPQAPAPYRIGDGSPGPMTRRLAAAYAALVAEECGTAPARA
jgi:branched-chain amino acid aminotransferase